MSLDLCVKQLHVVHIKVFYRMQYIRLLLFYSVIFQSAICSPSFSSPSFSSPSFSSPANSTPATSSVIFQSCKFHPLFFDGPSFSSPANSSHPSNSFLLADKHEFLRKPAAFVSLHSDAITAFQKRLDFVRRLVHMSSDEWTERMNVNVSRMKWLNEFCNSTSSRCANGRPCERQEK